MMFVFLEVVIGLTLLFASFALLMSMALKKRVYVAVILPDCDITGDTNIVGVFYKKESAESTLYRYSDSPPKPSIIIECIVNRKIEKTEPPPKGAIPLK